MKTKTQTYSVTIVTSVPWDTERVLRLVKSHMGKCLFSPELKSYLITQWNCTTIGLCRCRKMNQWVGSGAARTYGDDARQYSRRNGRGIWLYKRSFRHRILRFTSTEATTESCSYLARQVRSTRSVSQGTEVTIVTEYVPYRYSTHTRRIWELNLITPC